MANELGKLIGKVADTFSITNHNGDVVKLKVVWDFSTSSDADIKSWLAGNRRIAFQRPARAMSKDELEAIDGDTLAACDAGKKVKTRSERINDVVNAGIPAELAGFALDNPDKMNEIMALVQMAMDETSETNN